MPFLNAVSISLVNPSQIIIELKEPWSEFPELFNIAELSELPELPVSNGLTSPATALFAKLTVIVLIAQNANTGI